MKITDVKVVPVNKFLFVKVMTDEGITGLGESGDWGFLESSAEVINSFREYLIGQDRCASSTTGSICTAASISGEPL